jgi:hypothetical protein
MSSIRMPRTPDRKPSEVSAFSPWDSPSDFRANEHGKRDGEGPLKKAAIRAHLGFVGTSHTPSRESYVSSRTASSQTITNRSSVSTATMPSNETSARRHSQTNRPHRILDASFHARQDGKMAWRGCEKTARILKGLEIEIEGYPSCTLQLNSPVILLMRNRQSLDELHIERLGRIFTNVDSRSLSTLAALLLAQSYLSRLLLAPQRERTPLHESSRLVTSPSSSLTSLVSRTATTPVTKLDGVVATTEWHQALHQRVRQIEVALTVMVQKVMVVVCGRYDELVWRTLTCLVETVENYEC